MRLICGHIAYLTVRPLTIPTITGANNYLIVTTDTPLMSLSDSGQLAYISLICMRGADVCL